MEVKAGYKHTEIGLIPTDWDSCRIGHIIEEISMGPFGSDITVDNYVSNGVPVLSGYNVQLERLIDTFKNYVTHKKAKDLKKAVAQKGDIVITHRGTIGQVSFIPYESEYESYVISQSQFRVRFKKDRVLPAWVALYFHTKRGSERLLEGKGHTGVPAIAQPTTTFRKLFIPLPPLHEQQAVAKVLSDVDSFLESLDKLITKKQNIKQAAMQELLTGKTRLPGYDVEWDKISIARHATLKARIGWQGLTTAEYLDSGSYVLVTGTDFENGKIDWNNCHFVEKARYDQDKNIQLQTSDVLLTKDGTIGKAAYIEDLHIPATLNSGVFVIRPRDYKYYPKYLYYVLKSQIFTDFLNKLQAGSTISHLYQKDFVNFEFMAPSKIEEQKVIATILSDMDAEIQALEQRHSKLLDLKQGMMQELLTGKTRLVQPETESHVEQKASESKANIYFKRSVLAAEIVERLHNEPTFGHVKFEKIVFLVEHLCNVDTGSSYERHAAGPYDSKALRSIDSQMKKQKWFAVQKNDGRYSYIPLEKSGGHKTYFNRYFASISNQLDDILSTFRTSTTEQCEIVTTLYSAWNDLLHQDKAVTDEAIINEVLNNWHESKKRISRDRWLKALNWMRERGYTPTHDNQHGESK